MTLLVVRGDVGDFLPCLGPDPPMLCPSPLQATRSVRHCGTLQMHHGPCEVLLSMTLAAVVNSGVYLNPRVLACHFVYVRCRL